MSDPLREFLARHGVKDAAAFLEDAEQSLEWGPSFRECAEIASLRARLAEVEGERDTLAFHCAWIADTWTRDEVWPGGDVEEASSYASHARGGLAKVSANTRGRALTAVFRARAALEDQS